MTDVEKKVDMSLDELVAMRQKEAKKKARRQRPRNAIDATASP